MLKKGKLMAVLGVMLAAHLMMGSTSQAADRAAPGEGYYAGAFLGFGTETGRLAKLANLGTDSTQGGGWLGWGMKRADDLYLGAEIEVAGSDGELDALTATAKESWQTGGAIRLGYYVNSETLFSLKFGVTVGQLIVIPHSGLCCSKTYTRVGPQVGASFETTLSKVNPISLRMEFVYTDYADIETTIDFIALQFTGESSAARIGLTYSF